MVDPRADYLASLRRVLAEESEPTTASVVHNEVATHLDAAIQARMELGESPDDAVANAIAALGSPESFAPLVASVHAPERELHDRRVSIATFGFAATIVGYLLAVPLAMWNQISNTEFLQIFGILFLISLSLVGVFSFLSRTFRLSHVVKGAIAAGIGVWIILSVAWFDVGREGGGGIVPRWEVGNIRSLQEGIMAKNAHNVVVARSILEARAVKGDEAIRLRAQLGVLEREELNGQRQREAFEAAVHRTLAERMVATTQDGLVTAAASGIVLLLFHGAGVYAGRRVRRRRTAGGVHA